MSMREKIARSIMADMGRQNPSLDPVDDGELLGMADDYDNKFYDGYGLADAVLDALMEPTVDVEVAGDSAHDHAVPNALEIWKAMIQAAKEGK